VNRNSTDEILIVCEAFAENHDALETQEHTATPFPCSLIEHHPHLWMINKPSTAFNEFDELV
jgi:hypothetical protein